MASAFRKTALDEGRSPNLPETVTFGPFQLFPRSRELRTGTDRVTIGSRAAEILILLIEHAGDVVSKEEIFARVWPGLFVDESNLRVHITALRKALGEVRGEHRFIATVPGRGYSFVGPVTDTQVRTDPPRTALPETLPVRLSAVFGRESSVVAIASRLPLHRFVTITGPGGIGKTTVALEAVAALDGCYADPACFVDLGVLTDAAQVASGVAATLGAHGSGDPTAALLSFVRDRDMLIVLDCCEPVVGAAALLAETMLKRAPRLHILATSREPLRAEGEHVFRLAGLDTPPADGALTAEAALAFPAIQLFVERITAADDGFVLSDRDAPLTADICRRLGGVPLAIELAATRVAQLGLHDVAKRLDERFTLLMRGRRTALPRHQTLGATLDWSFQLLAPHEQDLLCRLSVFRGIFTWEAARAVALPAADLSDAGLVGCIASLTDKSFLATDSLGQSMAYRCLDVPRAWLREKLQASGAAEDVARLHALYFKDLLERAESAWDRLAPSEIRRTLGRHSDNVRAALDWAFGAGRAPEIGIALTIAAAPLWIAMFLFEECRQHVARALAALAETPGGDPRQEMRLFATLGIMTQHTDGIGERLDYPWRKTLLLAQNLGDLDYQLRALRGLTNAALTQDHRVALDYARQYRAAAEASSDPDDVLIGDRMIGFVLHHLGEQEQARRLTEGMLACYVRRPDRRRLADGTPDAPAVAKVILARILWLQGFSDRALRVANDAVQEAVTLEHPVSLFSVIAYAACPIALLEGDLGRAAAAHDILRAMYKQHPPFGRWSDGFAALDVMRRGDTAAGLEMLHEATQAMRDDAFAASFPLFVAGRIEGLSRCGMLDDARAAADAALARCRAVNEYWYMPEFLRLRGEVRLLAGQPGSAAEAEQDFEAALALARSQTALAWELRIATSLARLRDGQDLSAAARATLAPVLDRFSEGFDTADLTAARAAIAALDAQG